MHGMVFTWASVYFWWAQKKLVPWVFPRSRKEPSWELVPCYSIFYPIFTGAIADKIGYKKVLLLAFLIYASGFYMIQQFSSFEMVFISFIWICVGGAFFKPIISATISKTTTAETASIGFGIFYMMVNIGGFIGPFVAGIVLGKGWNFVFMLSIIAIAINFLITLLFFKDLKQEKVSTPLLQSIVQPFKNIFIMLINWRYTMFLLIMSLFWAAFNQLYYTFPIFVEDWVNTTTIYNGNTFHFFQRLPN